VRAGRGVCRGVPLELESLDLVDLPSDATLSVWSEKWEYSLFDPDGLDSIMLGSYQASREGPMLPSPKPTFLPGGVVPPARGKGEVQSS
jgi:hypothetical protein